MAVPSAGPGLSGDLPRRVGLQGPRQRQCEEQGAAHLAVGVDCEGRKQVLGIWIETTEGAKFWLRVLNELKSRGVEDVLIVVCDGLTGLPEAITTVWPAATVQTCIVHLIRASLRWVNYKDRRRVAAALRGIYDAPTEASARDALDALADSNIAREYPGIIRRWREAWERVIPFFDFPPEVRKVIYTTDESVNAGGGVVWPAFPQGLPGACCHVTPAAGVKAGRRPPGGLGLDAGEDGAILVGRGGPGGLVLVGGESYRDGGGRG
jgi:Transposase, Mutator family